MAGLVSAPNDRARAGGANEHAMVPAAALHGSPAYRRDWDCARDVSRPSLTYGAPPGYPECPSVQEFWRMTSPDRSGHPLLVAA
jgi:hypothetical protein